MLFGGLFSAHFVLRAAAREPWRPVGSHLTSASVGTVLLLGGSVALAVALRMARARRINEYRNWMLAATLLPALFLSNRALEYFDLARLYIYPATGTQWAMYYLLTGVHALHVLAGVIVNAALMLTAESTWIGAAPRAIQRVQAVSLYWYFVDLVWLVLFVILYVVA
jgi:cytochrome c oxidase subunit III